MCYNNRKIVLYQLKILFIPQLTDSIGHIRFAEACFLIVLVITLNKKLLWSLVKNLQPSTRTSKIRFLWLFVFIRSMNALTSNRETEWCNVQEPLTKLRLFNWISWLFNVSKTFQSAFSNLKISMKNRKLLSVWTTAKSEKTKRNTELPITNTELSMQINLCETKIDYIIIRMSLKNTITNVYFQ